MKPSSSTLYLLQALRWLSRAIWWRKEANQDSTVSTAHIMQVASWARHDFRLWKRETFQA